MTLSITAPRTRLSITSPSGGTVIAGGSARVLTVEAGRGPQGVQGETGATGATGARGPGATWKSGASTLAERAYAKVDGAVMTATDDGTNVVLDVAAAATGQRGTMSAADKAKLDGLLSSPPGTVLWEWNGTDTSQFENAATLDVGTGGSTPTLSVVANAAYPGGNVLRFNGNGRVNGQVGWLATATLSTLNYRIEIELAAAAAGSGTTYRGPLYYADVTLGSLYGFGYGTNGGTGYAKRIDAGSVSSGTTTPSIGGTATYPRLNTLDVRGECLVGIGPRFVAYAQGFGGGVGAASINQLSNASAIPAGWHALTPQRFGLWMNCSDGGGNLGSCDISRMRVVQL